MDLASFTLGIAVGVVGTAISDFLRPWISRANRRLASWLDAKGDERAGRRAEREAKRQKP
jgi:cytidylate kinase